MDEEHLQKAILRLGEAALDPAVWPSVIEDISRAAGATGALLLQGDVRTPDIPRSTGVGDLTDKYFAEGWHARDVRAVRGVPLLLSGHQVVIDQDLFSPDEIARDDFYQGCLSPNGFQWFAAIGFRSGPALWGLSIQRTPREGPFEAADKRALARLADRLTETATLSQAFGRQALAATANALNRLGRPAVALDRLGRVLEATEAAERLFDDEIRVRERRIFVRDRDARSALDNLTDRLRTTPHSAALPTAPIVVRREGSRPVLITVLPIDGAASGPFFGARVLLTFSDLAAQPAPPASLLTQVFGLTQAEARLAALIATGVSPEGAAERLGIAAETARNHLKAVFAKTDTHRQSELVALLSRL